MISIILYKPQQPGNIGAIARAMKNFGFENLVLIEPECPHLSKESLDRATKAKDILKKAEVKKKTALKDFDYLIATTSALGRDYNVPRSPISPAQLAEKIKSVSESANIGILFGPEDHGLSNKEISLSDFVVTIPVSKEYPVMNLSHAVSLVCYELFKASKAKKVADHMKTAGEKEKTLLLGHIKDILNSLEFATPEKKETQKLIWKRMLGKSFLTKREAFALFGFFKKVKDKMK